MEIKVGSIVRLSPQHKAPALRGIFYTVTYIRKFTADCEWQGRTHIFDLDKLILIK